MPGRQPAGRAADRFHPRPHPAALARRAGALRACPPRLLGKGRGRAPSLRRGPDARVVNRVSLSRKRAKNFYPRPLRPGFFLSCEKLAWRHRGPKEAPARGNRAAAQLSPATLLAEARRTTTADIVGAPAWWSPTMSRPGATG